MTAEEHDLLASVLANHADDLPRLVLADWWEENGQPDRAELVRLGCELELIGLSPRDHKPRCRCRRCKLTTRLLDLLESYAATWAGPAKPLRRLLWSRGFIGSVTCDAAAWLAHGDAVLAAHPVTRVSFTDWLRWDHIDGLTTDQKLEAMGRYRGGDIPLAMCRLRWPGVEFELPPEPRYDTAAEAFLASRQEQARRMTELERLTELHRRGLVSDETLTAALTESLQAVSRPLSDVLNPPRGR